MQLYLKLSLSYMNNTFPFHCLNWSEIGFCHLLNKLGGFLAQQTNGLQAPLFRPPVFWIRTTY